MGWLDWAVIGAYFAVLVAIGLYYSRRNKTAEDFVLAGRSMSPIALGLSLFATLCSTLSYLAWPGEIIAYGPMLLAAQFAAYPLIAIVVGYGLIPLLMRQPVTSAYELLESRLGLSVRLAGAGVFLMLRLGWMATILYATSYTVLIPLLKLDPRWTPALCGVLGIITVIYSAAGGLKAVVVTDALQSIMMLVGAGATIFVISHLVDGTENWFPKTWPGHWSMPSWGFDPSARISFGMGLMSTIVWYVCTTGSDHMTIQRFLATRDPRAARQTLVVSFVTEVVVTSLLALTGIAILGYYLKYPPDLPEGQTLINRADTLFPMFILSRLPNGLAGMVVAAILAAAMSSLSSGVNSTTAVLDEDFLSRMAGGRRTGTAAVVRMRWLSVLVGVVSVALSILNTFIEGNLIERCYKVVNLLTAPLFVLFFLALFVKFATPAGAWLGLLSSTAVAVAIAYLDVGISFPWMMPLSLLTGITVGLLGSAVSRVLLPRQPPE